MSRLDLATTLIVVLCLAALGFLIYKAVELYSGPEEPAIVEEPDSYYDTDYGNADDVYTDADSLNSNTEGNLDDDLTYDDVTPTESDDNSFVAEAPAEPEEEEVKPVSPPKSGPASSSSSGGNYMVIAGSYSQKVNAENQVTRLRGMGYDETQMEIFNGGALAVVLVNRFDSYNSARALYDELKGKGVEVFIKKKQ